MEENARRSGEEAEKRRRREEAEARLRAEEESRQKAEDKRFAAEAARPAQPSRLPSRLIAAAAGVVLAGLVGLVLVANVKHAPQAPPTPSAMPHPSPRPHTIPAPEFSPPPHTVPVPEFSSSPLADIAIALAVGLVIGALAVWGWTVWSRRRLKPISKVSIIGLPQGTDGAPQVFVSYSRQDEQTVDQLVEQIRQLGYTVWIDRQSTGSQRYAAQIVRAIRDSRLVALMCSAHAFTSDHVIREVYVAGGNKKPFIVFLLEPTEFPDEVLYFVSGFPRIVVASLDPEQLRSEITRLAVIA